MPSTVPSSGSVNSVIRITGSGDRDRPEWLIRISGIRTLLEVLSTEDEIEAATGKPTPRMLAKVVDSLDDICRAFIARSPFVVVASSDSKGRCDVSPKG